MSLAPVTLEPLARRGQRPRRQLSERWAAEVALPRLAELALERQRPRQGLMAGRVCPHCGAGAPGAATSVSGSTSCAVAQVSQLGAVCPSLPCTVRAK